jgi:hypothetical protein
MAGPDTSRHTHPHTRHCPKCQLERAQRHAGNNQLVIHGPDGLPDGAPCAACAQGAMVAGEAPGIAMLGPGTTSIVSPEPAPIGVVQASYRPGGAGPLAPSAAMMGYGARPGMVPGYPVGAVPPPQTAYLGSHRRPSVLGHLFGLDSRVSWGEAHRARLMSAHAATRVGNPAALAPITELPASVVYGR